jgi:hypothetical protein
MFSGRPIYVFGPLHIPVDKDAAAQGKWHRLVPPSEQFIITRHEALNMMMNTAREINLKHYRVIDRELSDLAKNVHHGTFIRQHHVDEYSRLRLANGEPSNIVVLPPALWADDRGPGSVNPLMPISVRAIIVASELAALHRGAAHVEKIVAAYTDDN